jgi:PilZ domain-containing protein
MRVTDVANPEFSASGETTDISENGIGIYLPLDFARGSLVRLNIKDSVLYGFVAYSVPERSFFRTGIAVAQVSIGPSGLSQLLKATLEKSMPHVQITSTCV